MVWQGQVVCRLHNLDSDLQINILPFFIEPLDTNSSAVSSLYNSEMLQDPSVSAVEMLKQPYKVGLGLGVQLNFFMFD